MIQGFQACTPRVLPLGFGILLRDPRKLYKGYIKAILGLCGALGLLTCLGL